MYCNIHTIYCNIHTICTVIYTLYTVIYTLHTVIYTLYTVIHTLHTVIYKIALIHLYTEHLIQSLVEYSKVQMLSLQYSTVPSHSITENIILIFTSKQI